ncbi:MAG: CpXC domain-containing protein [Bacteroidaceae bacterium]|nr:CpXC domain-containing protein [Bacteroidaceae bacterium]
MSKLIDITVTCPHCGRQYNAKVFRTLWGDGGTAENNILSNDKTNVVECPDCHYAFRAPLAMMYVDCRAGFAVWWEPIHDDGIDSDATAYANMFGPDSYYAKAPRIEDWEDFKDTVRKYYTGELKANPITKFNFQGLQGQSSKQKSSNTGCLGVLILLIGLFSSIGLGLIHII